MDVEEMAKKATLKDFEGHSQETRKTGLLPIKLKIAQMIPKEELEALVIGRLSFPHLNSLLKIKTYIENKKNN